MSAEQLNIQYEMSRELSLNKRDLSYVKNKLLLDVEKELDSAKFPFPPIFYLSKFQFLYKTNKMTIEEVCDKITSFFHSVDVDNQLKATYNRKMG